MAAIVIFVLLIVAAAVVVGAVIFIFLYYKGKINMKGESYGMCDHHCHHTLTGKLQREEPVFIGIL